MPRRVHRIAQRVHAVACSVGSSSGLDPIGQRLPWRDVPIGSCGAGGRGEDEDFGEIGGAVGLVSVGNGARRVFSEPDAGGFLACEGYGPRPVAANICHELRRIELVAGNLVIHARTELRHVGEADVQCEQIAIFFRRKLAWRQPNLVQRAPEAIAATGVVVAQFSGALPCRRADEDDAEVGCEEVGEPRIAHDVESQ